MDAGRGRLPGVPGPLRQRRHHQRPVTDATPGPDGADRFRHGDVYGNPILVKGWDELPGGLLPGVPGARLRRAAAGPRLLRRRPGGHHRPSRRPGGARHHGAVPEPHLRGAVEPPLRHVRLLRHRPRPWHRRGLRRARRGGARAGHQGHPRWRVQSRLVQFAVVRPDGPLRGGRCLRVGRLAIPIVVHVPGTRPGRAVAVRTVDTRRQRHLLRELGGFDTIPALSETPEVVEIVTGQDGVVRYWLAGASMAGGWMSRTASARTCFERSGPRPGPWTPIRSSSRSSGATRPRGCLATRATRPWTTDSGVRSSASSTAPPSTRTARSRPSRPPASRTRCWACRRITRPPAWDALLNMVDSHDTTRILWTLTPATENEAAEGGPRRARRGKRRLAMLATIQLTFPGMASIFYGDEVGLTGHDDPDDRRPYPWEPRTPRPRPYQPWPCCARRPRRCARATSVPRADDGSTTLASSGGRTGSGADDPQPRTATSSTDGAPCGRATLPDGKRAARAWPLHEAGVAVTVADGVVYRLTVPSPVRGGAARPPEWDLNLSAPGRTRLRSRSWRAQDAWT